MGTVERTLIELIAPATEVIEGVPVQLGQRVERGASIVELDSTLARADVASADANLARARSELSVAEEEYARAGKLHKDRVIPQQKLDRARLAFDEANALLREAEVRREASLKRRDDLSLRAPVAGIVDQLPFNVGERVPVGAVLAVLAPDAAPWVRVWLPERALARIPENAEVSISVDGLAPLSGHLIEIAREPQYTPHFALTERERALLVFEARIAIEDPPATLRAGLPAEVEISLEGPRAPS